MCDQFPHPSAVGYDRAMKLPDAITIVARIAYGVAYVVLCAGLWGSFWDQPDNRETPLILANVVALLMMPLCERKHGR